MKAKDEAGQHMAPDSQATGISQLAPPGVVVLATICEASKEGLTRIRLVDSGEEVIALSNQHYDLADLDTTVACIGIQASDALLIIGTVHMPNVHSATTPRTSVLNQLLENYQSSSEDEVVFEHDSAAELEGMPNADIEEEVLIEAGRTLTIKCGASSISLSADGRVNIRGKFVTNSASQLNRIAGGSVKIN